jgi:hypothetical protein
MENSQEFIVHYSRGEPFRSITGVSHDDFASVLKTLNETNAWGLARFQDPQYLAQRRQMEKDLRKRFIEGGGRPVLQNPIYFFLGRHPGFEAHERNIAHVIHLKDVNPGTVSFSYGDSMFCFHEDNRRIAGEKYRSRLCDDLYRIEDLARLHREIPKMESLHIEAQLWVEPDRRSVKILRV